MTKTAILVLNVNGLENKLTSLSNKLLANYANKIGADLIITPSDDNPYGVPGFFKFDIIKKALEEYDRVLYVNSEVLITPDAPNVFDVIPEDEIGVFDQHSIYNCEKYWDQFFSITKTPHYYIPHWALGSVIVASKRHAELFIPLANTTLDTLEAVARGLGRDCAGEEGYLNWRLATHKPNIHSLHYKWCRSPLLTNLTGEHLLDGHFIDLTAFPELIEDNAKKLLAGLGKRHLTKIRIDYEGALGDLVAGEPLIRYLVTEMYGKNSEIVIRTNQPEVLKHLQIFSHVTIQNLIAPYSNDCFAINPLPPNTQDPIFNLVHPLDFMSIKAFKGTLPKDKRRVQLKTNAKRFGVGGHVLVHFGKGWSSKTFPLEYCEAVVQQLLALGLKVCLIGNRVVPVKGNQCLDLRGKTDNLIDFFTLVREAPILISNDSSPVHIAGAFNNHCIMIPTCKHPDHIFPFRPNPALNLALGKLLTYDQKPNQPKKVVRIDTATTEELMEVLPNPKAIAMEAKHRLDHGYLIDNTTTHNR